MSDGMELPIFGTVMLKDAFCVLLVLYHSVIAVALYHDLSCLFQLLFWLKWTTSDK